MIFDTDDLHATNHRLDLLERLHDANPLFRMTAFAVPAYCTPAFLASLPEWIECVPHGWDHGGPDCANAREAEHWTYDQAIDVLLSAPEGMARGWKSPGWQISDGTYLALHELGYWVADQHYNDHRRPEGIRFHCEGDGDHVHTHVQNVCGNGLEETFPALLERVRVAESFELVSEVVRPWVPERVAA
ncbi:MAG: hypothetical protein V7647_803 [Acidobacteriota bacterium]|jgi:hypothetical protein